MINLYIPLVPNPSEHDTPRISSRRSPPLSFLSTIEQQRYAYLSIKLREAGLASAAEMAARWAEEHRIAAHKLRALEAEDAA